MSDNIPINEIKPGMVLSDNKNRRYMVIDTNLNGDDDYYSSFTVISEDEYMENKGKEIAKSKLKTLCWIESHVYYEEYENCEEQYKISSEKIFMFE